MASETTREPTLDEIRAAASTGAGELVTVRHANSYLRLRFGWACDERDALRDALRDLLPWAKGNHDGGKTCDCARCEALGAAEAALAKAEGK